MARHAHEQPQRRHALASIEFRIAIVLAVVLAIVGGLSFRPTAADLIPLGLAPEVMTSPQPEPDVLPKADNSLNTKTEVSPWSMLGANAALSPNGSTPASGIHEPGWAEVGQHCSADDPYRTSVCFVLPPQNGGEPERMIYTIGNSHTVQLTAGLLEVIERHPTWGARVQGVPACPFAYRANPSDACEEMWKVGTQYILDRQPDLVVVMATRSSSDGPENLLPGLADWVRMITSQTTIKVLLVRDNPRFSSDIHECAKLHGPHDQSCAYPYHYEPLNDQRQLLEDAGGIYVDLNQVICPDGACRPVIGGVWTFLDENHLGADYWRTLIGPLSLRMHTAIPWWPKRPYLGEMLVRQKLPTAPVI